MGVFLFTSNAFAESLNANLGLKADLGGQNGDKKEPRPGMRSDINVDTQVRTKSDLSPDAKVNLGAHLGYGQRVSFSSQKIAATVDILSQFGDKLEARIAAAKAKGENVETETALYVQYEAKVAEAKLSAQAAADVVKNMSSDTEDKATSEANKKAAMQVRVNIKASIDALKDARALAGKIVVELKADSK